MLFFQTLFTRAALLKVEDSNKYLQSPSVDWDLFIRNHFGFFSVSGDISVFTFTREIIPRKMTQSSLVITFLQLFLLSSVTYPSGTKLLTTGNWAAQCNYSTLFANVLCNYSDCICITRQWFNTASSKLPTKLPQQLKLLLWETFASQLHGSN